MTFFYLYIGFLTTFLPFCSPYRVLGVGGALLPPLSVGPNSSDLLKEAAYVDEDFQYSLLTSAPPGPVFQCSPEADRKSVV